jgi:cytochrome c peroxidase
MRRLVTTVLLAGSLLAAGCPSGDDSAGAPSADPATERADGPLADEPFTEQERRLIATLSPLPEPPANPTNAVAEDPEAAHFGRFLFFDRRLSGDGTVSCASCHNPRHGFSVPTRLGEGVDKTPRHPPSLLNAAYHKWYDWDGKADSLWAQAARPIENPAEHATSRTAVARLVYSTPSLAEAYTEIFEPLPDLSSTDRFPPEARPTPDRPDSAAHRAWQGMAPEDRRRVNRVFTNLLKSIAAYERRLVSGGAPFDRYVRGLKTGDAARLDALSPSAKRGLDLFIGEGRCVNCHNGPALTDGTFHNLGLGARPWLKRRDEGRWGGVERVKEATFNAAGPFSDQPSGRRADWLHFLKQTPEDHGQFKTPTLRNVELTAPYMHGGHFDTLEEVVEFYSTLDEQPQIGHREEMLEPLGLTDRQVDDLVAFLRSLTGDLPAARLMGPPAEPLPEDADDLSEK